MLISELEVPKPPHGKGWKERSRDMLVSMEESLAKVELAFADMRDRFEDVDQCIEKLESEGGDEELRGEMQGALNSTVDMLSKRDDAL